MQIGQILLLVQLDGATRQQVAVRAETAHHGRERRLDLRRAPLGQCLLLGRQLAIRGDQPFADLPALGEHVLTLPGGRDSLLDWTLRRRAELKRRGGEP